MFPAQDEECVRRCVGAYWHDARDAAPPESQPVAPDPVVTSPALFAGSGETTGWCSSVHSSMRGLAVSSDAYERALDDDRYGEEDDEDAYDDEEEDQYDDYEEEDDLYEDDELDDEEEEEEEDEEEVL